MENDVWIGAIIGGADTFLLCTDWLCKLICIGSARNARFGCCVLLVHVHLGSVLGAKTDPECRGDEWCGYGINTRSFICRASKVEL
jgi:hypothetical protein